MDCEKKTGGRLLSLDALRGFDMFFITGGAAAISGICAALGCQDGWLAVQMKHVEWTGLAQHDTIFPLFLFLSGVSWPFSLGSQLDRGRSVWRIQAKIAVRTAILFLLGFSFGGVLKFKPDFRLMGVLQYIGLSWGFAATAWLHIRRKGVLAALGAVLLVGYYALLHFCVAPGAPEGAWSYSVEGNIVSWLDKTVYGSHMVAGWGYEPESFFALPTGIALALMGMFAGSLLRRDDTQCPGRKCGVLAAFAVASGIAACVSILVLGDPIVKKLWTVSFVLSAASYSLFMLALFVFVVDVLGLRRWTVVFDPVGKNSILAYMLMMTGVMSVLQRWLFSGLCGYVDAWGGALTGLTSYLVTWTILWYLGRKGVFLKV